MTTIGLAGADVLRVSAALWRARGEHVVRLEEVREGPDGLLLLELAGGGVPLAEVLARDLELGEAVTVLVPIVETLERLAAVGVVHGAVSVAAVELDERGAPVLVGFENAIVGAGPDPHAGGAGDRAAFRALADAVLGAVPDDADAMGRLLGELAETDLSAPGSLAAFAERLLAAAQPRPVRLGLPAADRRAAEPPAPQRQAGRARVSAVRTSPAAAIGSIVRRSTSRLAGIRLPAGLRSRLGRVRARFWVPAVGAALGLAAAAALLPAQPDAQGPGTAASTAEALPIASSRPTSTPTTAVIALDPVSAVLGLRPDASAATVVDDYGDVVLLRLDTVAGVEDALIERTLTGWRLRDLVVAED